MKLITLTLDLDALPASISESIATVLTQHGLAIVRESDTQYPWDGARLEKLLRELGRNVAGMVAMSDETEVEIAA